MHSLEYLISEIQVKLSAVQNAFEVKSKSSYALKTSTEDASKSIQNSFDNHVQELHARRIQLMTQLNSISKQQANMLVQQANTLACLHEQLEECVPNEEQMLKILATEEQKAAFRQKIADALQVASHIQLYDSIEENILHFTGDNVPLQNAIHTFGKITDNVSTYKELYETDATKWLTDNTHGGNKYVAMSEDDIEVIQYEREEGIIEFVSCISLDEDSEDDFIRVKSSKNEKINDSQFPHMSQSEPTHEEDDTLKWLSSSKIILNKKPLQELASEKYNMAHWLYNNYQGNDGRQKEGAIIYQEIFNEEDTISMWLLSSRSPRKSSHLQGEESTLLDNWLANQHMDQYSPNSDEEEMKHLNEMPSLEHRASIVMGSGLDTWVAPRRSRLESSQETDDAFNRILGPYNVLLASQDDLYLYSGTGTGSDDGHSPSVSKGFEIILSHFDEIRNEISQSFLVHDASRSNVPAYCDWLKKGGGNRTSRCDACTGNCWIDTDEDMKVWKVTSCDW